MTCLHCASLNLQKHPEHAKVGLGQCAHEQAIGHFIGLKHACKKFAATTSDIIEKRQDWYKKNIQKGNASGIKKT